MAIRRGSRRPAPKRKSANRAPTAAKRADTQAAGGQPRHGPKHIPLDAHAREERRFEKARSTSRSIDTTFSPDATRTKRARKRRGGPTAAAAAETEVVDPRLTGPLTPVRSQPDGDRRCVGFALAAAMETWLCLRDPAMATDPILSEQHVFKLGDEKEIVAPAAKAVKKGVVETICFGSQPPCPDQKDHTWSGKVEQVLSNDPKVLCAHLRGRLPLVNEMRIAGNFADFQGDGVYIPDNTPGGAHALVIVGFERNADGTGAWIVKNSLGADWGEDGFGRIRWRDPFCKPENVVFVVKEVKRVQ